MHEIIDMTDDTDVVSHPYNRTEKVIQNHKTPQNTLKRKSTDLSRPNGTRSKSVPANNDKVEFVSHAHVTCIVCNQSLFALLDSERQRHVNKCLDFLNGVDDTPTHHVKTEPHNDNTIFDKSVQVTEKPPMSNLSMNAQSNKSNDNTVNNDLPVVFDAQPAVFSFGGSTSVPSQAIEQSNGLSQCTVCHIDISTMKWKQAVEHMKQCKLKQQVNTDDLVITDAIIAPPPASTDTKWSNVVQKRRATSGKNKPTTSTGKKPRVSRVKSEPVVDTAPQSNDVNSVLKPMTAAKLNKALYVNRWSKRVMGTDYNSAFGKKGTVKEARPTPAYKLLENTGILIDGFHFKSPVGIYYLTHYHSDHYTGLTTKFDGRKLYCSHITARLVEMFFKIKAPVLHSLELHKRHYLDGIYVTLIDANHCPGANVLIFEVPLYMCITNKQQQQQQTIKVEQTAIKQEFTDMTNNMVNGVNQQNTETTDITVKQEITDNETVMPSQLVKPEPMYDDGYTGECRVWVHCGDFRYHRSMRELFLRADNMIESTIFPSSYHLPYHSAAYQQLCTHLNQLNIYGVFLDTTYCNSRYNFPPQGDSVGYAVQAVKDMLAKECEYNAANGLTDMELHPSRLGVESDTDEHENDDSTNVMTIDELNDNEHNEQEDGSIVLTHDDVTNECADINTDDNNAAATMPQIQHAVSDTVTSGDINEPKPLSTLQTYNESSIPSVQQTSPFHKSNHSHNQFSVPLTARRTRDGEVKLITSSSNNFVGRLFSGVKQSFTNITSNSTNTSTGDVTSAWRNLLGGYTKQHKAAHATRTLFLVGTYSVGKEKVFVEIAKQCNLSIYVTTDRRRMLSVLELDKHIPTGVHCDIDTLTQQRYNTIPTVHFTSNPLHSRLHVVPLGYINKQNIMKYIDPTINTKAAKLFFPIKPTTSSKKSSFDRKYKDVHNPLLPYNHIVAFRPTGWVGNKPYTTDFYVNINNPDTTCEPQYAKATLHITIHHVPYSEHSTYNELKEFITVLSICGLQSIVPTVSPYISNQIIQRELVHLTHKNIPHSAIKAVKNTQHKLNFIKLEQTNDENSSSDSNNVDCI